jgi:proteasome accessory factor B
VKTSRISRILQLLTVLQSGQDHSVDGLVGVLKISKRMVFRDLSELRKIGIPCNFNKTARSYQIHPSFFLPPSNLESQEALGLLLLAHKARHHIHFPFRDSMLQAALKIESELPESTKRFCNNALKRIHIKANPQEKIDLLDNKFSQFLEAILHKKIIRITYSSPDNEEIVTGLHPYHLMYNDYAWHVLGKLEIDNKIYTLKLNRIVRFQLLETRFVESESFDLAGYIGRAWSMKPEGKLYNIKLRFLSEAAHNVMNVQWHSTQQSYFQDDGSMIMEFRVDGIEEITWWILSYGDKVQVVAPECLRHRIKDIAQNIMRQNETANRNELS